MLDWPDCPAVERVPEKVSNAWLFRGTRVPVRAFVNPQNRIMVYRKENTRRTAGPAFLLNEMLVWGFTGQVIAAMLDVAGWAQPWNTDDIRELDEAMALVGHGDSYGEPQQ